MNVITLTRDWCNYGEMMDMLSAKYAIKGPQAPDVIDIGPSHGALAKEQGLIASCKVQTRNSLQEPNTNQLLIK